MKKKNWILLLTGTFFLSLFFVFPYLSNELSLEHDTLFHLSRIEGLAQSFKSGKIFPDIYPMKNDGFGYASALFYCDLFLVPAALLYLAGFEVAIGWKTTIFLFTWLSGISMALLLKKLKQDDLTSLFASALYLFSNYRITDVYVRGALGEVLAMSFLPFVICGFYELFLQDQAETKTLIIGFTGVALSHNLTLLLTGLGFLFLMILSYRKITFDKIKKLFHAALITIGLCAWFLFPMLEQTAWQTYYLHYYASSSDLDAHALMSWQYLINETIFGYSGNQRAYAQTMAVTPGLFLLFLPICGLWDIAEKDQHIKFAYQCTFAGYFFTFLCSDIIPWNQLSFLRIMQFPWRWMTLSCIFLAIGASISCARILKSKHKIMMVLFVCLLLNSIHLLLPVISRTLVIYNNTTYEELLSGKIIDPYYGNSTYNRIEVAGADYLPVGFLDYKNASHCLTDLSGNEISCILQKNHTSISFQVPKNTEILLPITAYKGYHIYAEKSELPWTTVFGRICFNTKEFSNFTITYQKTGIHHFSIGLSMFTILMILLKSIIKKAVKP